MEASGGNFATTELCRAGKAQSAEAHFQGGLEHQMADAEPHTVKSVQKALHLLQELNKRPFNSVSELHQALKLPKPTIIRMLRTMQEAGFVYHDRRQGGYQITSLARTLSQGFEGIPMVVEAGREPAVELTRNLRWPSSIGIFDQNAIMVRYSTAPDSPVAPFQSSVNMRLSLATRALGRAYLAFCPGPDIENAVSRLASSGHPEDQWASDQEVLLRLLERIRQQGFAQRCPSIKPHTSTVAVPIRHDGRVLASLGLTFYTSAVKPYEVRRRILPEMERRRDEIESHFSRLFADQRVPALGDAATVASS